MQGNFLARFSTANREKATFYFKDKYKEVLLNLDIDSLRKEALEKGNVRSGREPHAVIHVPELTDERIIVRHSRHGGLFGHIAGDIFCRGNRFMNELLASETAIEKGVNTAEVIAVITHKVFGPFYRMDVLSKEIPDCQDLVEFLTNPPQEINLADRKNIIKEAAQTTRKMHDAGLYHTDLHLKNILIQRTPDKKDLKAYVIDLDKAKKMNVVSERLRMRNLSRLDRSVEKLKASSKLKAGTIPGKTDKRRFLLAYIDGDAEKKQYLKTPTRTYRLHRLLWSLFQLRGNQK